MDITKERTQYVWMGYDENHLSMGKWQLIQYEDLLEYCLHCKHQGHSIGKCMIKRIDEETLRRKEEEEATGSIDDKGEQTKNAQQQKTQQHNSQRTSTRMQGMLLLEISSGKFKEGNPAKQDESKGNKVLISMTKQIITFSKLIL